MSTDHDTNTALQHRIERALRRDQRLSGQPIEVEVDDRHVRLRGTVQSARRKLAAGQIAAERSDAPVRNELRVEMPAQRSDEALAADVQAALARDAHDQHGSVAVRVRGGRAELFGAVASRAATRGLADVAMSVPGIRTIRNFLRVDRHAAQRDQAIADQARRELRQAGLPAAVSIVQRHAFLRPLAKDFNTATAARILGRMGLRAEQVAR